MDFEETIRAIVEWLFSARPVLPLYVDDVEE